MLPGHLQKIPKLVWLRRLADFGLSRVLDMNATHVSTQSFGTVPYMPPELLSQGRMTTKVDVYSFAILSAALLCWATCSTFCHRLHCNRQAL